VITEALLKDGTRALIWELLPGDREALRAGYEQLSEETRYHRFLTGVPHLTPALLDHLVDEVDGVNHLALVIVILDNDGVGVPVGVGRIIRYPDRPTVADMAVTVIDEYQGRGAATALVEELIRRRPEGVTRIATTITADNVASLAMLRHLGPTTVTESESPRLDVVADLEPPGAPEAAGESAHETAEIATDGPGDPLTQAR
jgi:RimJ/RimL family protein N-acetyltransferase